MAKTKNTKNNTVAMDRRSSAERREAERRKEAQPIETERRKGTRRNVNRRRQIDPTTCERDYTEEEIEFMQAMDAYKRSSGRMFPTCSEILEVVRSLGYEKKLAAIGGDTSDAGAESSKLASSSPLVAEIGTYDVVTFDDLEDDVELMSDEDALDP